MNISSTGISSVRAQRLQQAAGSAAVSAASGTTGSGSDTADQLSISAAGQQASGQGDPFQADLAGLASALTSGDLATARKAYAQMATEMKKHGDLPSDFAAIGTALDSGDLTAAKSALETVQKNTAGHQPPAAGANPLQQDMEQLGKLIQSGDTTSAQSLLEQILAKLGGTGSTSTGTSTGSTSTGTSTGSSTSDTGGDSALLKALKDLKAALAAGGTSNATSAYQALLAQVQAGAGLPSGVRSLESVASAAYRNSASLT